MTQPAPQAHGYPDFGRFTAQTDVELLNILAESVNPSVDHGPFACFGFQHVALTMSPDTKSFQYQLIWTVDQAATKTIITDGAVMPIASSNTLIFPVLGPWLTIRCTPRTAPGSHGIRVNIVPSNSSNVGANADATLFTGGFFNVAATSNQTFDFTNVFAGEASVWTHTQAASGIIEIEVLDLAGGTTLLASGSVTLAGMPKDSYFPLFIPPRPLRVVCVNNDAALKEFGFTISGRPTWGGR